MKRVLSIVVPLAGILVLAAAVSAWAGGSGNDDRSGNSGKTLTVVEHATTDATTDTGDPGDTAGDVLTFANDVFNAADTAKVGTDQGYCIRVVKGASYECNWTTLLPGGHSWSRARSSTPRTAPWRSPAARGAIAARAGRWISARSPAERSSPSRSTSRADREPVLHLRDEHLRVGVHGRVPVAR